MSSLMTWCSNHVDPISIFLTSSSSSGDHLLFRYPYKSNSTEVNGFHNSDNNHNLESDNVYKTNLSVKASQINSKSNEELSSNPFSISLDEDISKSNHIYGLNSQNDSSFTFLENDGFDQDGLLSLLSVKKEMCGQKLEFKIDDVVFVGYPCFVESTMSVFNVTFAMHSIAPSSVIQNYSKLARKIACAIHHEEQRSKYLTNEKSEINRILDENHHSNDGFSIVHQKSNLCSKLVEVIHQIKKTGIVFVRMNDWVPISHCLPHKVYSISREVQVHPDIVMNAVSSMSPYHSLLLLNHPHTSPDSNQTLERLLRAIDPPLKTLQQLATTLDLTYSHIYQLASSLVLWGYAIIVFPICETNLYLPAPYMDQYMSEDLLIDFASRFPSYCLAEILSQFSQPVQVRDHLELCDPPKQQTEILTWMLRKRLLIQMHCYLTLAKDLGNPGEIAQFDSLNPRLVSAFRQHVGTNWSSVLSYLLLLPGGRDTQMLEMMAELLPYLNGQHHIEEIMYRENKTRSELMRCIDMFPTALIVTQMPDAVASSFVGVV